MRLRVAFFNPQHAARMRARQVAYFGALPVPRARYLVGPSSWALSEPWAFSCARKPPARAPPAGSGAREVRGCHPSTAGPVQHNTRLKYQIPRHGHARAMDPGQPPDLRAHSPRPTAIQIAKQFLFTSHQVGGGVGWPGGPLGSNARRPMVEFEGPPQHAAPQQKRESVRHRNRHRPSSPSNPIVRSPPSSIHSFIHS